MGKIVMFMVLILGMACADTMSTELEYNCLVCHKTQQIPNTLIYRRYLMKYSTPQRIEEVMVHYLKAPKKSHSIMPPQFFLKFPMKKSLGMDDTVLREYVRRYIEQFDVKQYLILDK